MATRLRTAISWCCASRCSTIVGMALVAAVWANGWLDDMVATDRCHLVKLNVGVFVVGLAICGNRIVKLSQDLNELKKNGSRPGSRVTMYRRAIAGKGSQSRALIAEALKMKFGVRPGSIRHLANTIGLIGLIGTLVGSVLTRVAAPRALWRKRHRIARMRAKCDIDHTAGDCAASTFRSGRIAQESRAPA
jgi:hypothetical protein